MYFRRQLLCVYKMFYLGIPFFTMFEINRQNYSCAKRNKSYVAKGIKHWISNLLKKKYKGSFCNISKSVSIKNE